MRAATDSKVRAAAGGGDNGVVVDARDHTLATSPRNQTRLRGPYRDVHPSSEAYAQAAARKQALMILAHIYEMFPQDKCTRAYGEGDVAGTWAKLTGDLSGAEVTRGLNALLHSGRGWPPSIPEFRALCRPSRRSEPYVPALPLMYSPEERARGRENIAKLMATLRHGTREKTT